MNVPRIALAVSSIATLLASVGASAKGEDRPDYYRPNEFANMDLDSPDSKWSWERSRESDHFFCFWEKGFGDDPNAESVPEELRVDVDDLLEKAERFWRTNVESVQMVELGKSKSRLDQYKTQIYLFHTRDWIATGAGYDDVIGALWISPATCKPVGPVIAHEIGHSFQYQVYCDQKFAKNASLGESGFRYGHSESHGGNGFWEQCAQWVAFEDYPDAAVAPGELGDWLRDANLAFEHEYTRYQSYWLQKFWAKKRGPAALGRIWRESARPEDSLAAYARIFLENDLNRFADELYEYGIAVASDALLPNGAESLAKRFQTTFYDVDDGWKQIAYASCPELAGFNIVPIPFAPGETVEIEFQALPQGAPLAKEAPGQYRATNLETGAVERRGKLERYNETKGRLALRRGLVATKGRETLARTETSESTSDRLSLSIPEETESVYLVVVGVPEDALFCNPWDDDNRTDAQAPYRFRIAP